MTFSLLELKNAVGEQAKDEGLWFNAVTAPEAYLQQEIRKLHNIVENLSIWAKQDEEIST